MEMSFVRKVPRNHDKLVCVLAAEYSKDTTLCGVTYLRAESFEYSATKTQIRLSSFLYTGVQCNGIEIWIIL